MTRLNESDPFVVAAKVLWECRPASKVVPWHDITDVGQDKLIADVRAVIQAWQRQQDAAWYERNEA